VQEGAKAPPKPSGQRLPEEITMTEKSGHLPTPGGDNPNVRYLTEHTDLSPKQVRELIEEHGNDRDRLLQIARTMKAES
jgi:hypothetical protein